MIGGVYHPSTHHRSLSIDVQIWIEVCQCAFDVAIEGFSKARKCSSEGRSAMVMDAFALHDSLNQIHLCRSPDMH